MAFLDDLIIAFTEDTSVNAWATGGMKYHELPSDAIYTKNWILFGFSEDEVIRTFGGFTSTKYALEIQLKSPDLDSVKACFNLLDTHLSNYTTNGLEFLSLGADFEEYDSEKNAYSKTLRYSILT